DVRVVAGRDALAGLEARVLSEIRQVGRDQPDAGGAEITRGGCGEEERNGAQVGRMQRAGEDDLAAADRRADTHVGFTIRKPTQDALAAFGTEPDGERGGEVVVVREREDDRSHARSSTRTMSGRASTKDNAYASSPGDSACSVKSGAPASTRSPTRTCSSRPAAGSLGAPASLAARARRRLSMRATRPARAAATGCRCGASGGSRM